MTNVAEENRTILLDVFDSFSGPVPSDFWSFEELASVLAYRLSDRGYQIIPFIVLPTLEQPPPPQNWRELSDVATYGDEKDNLE